MTIKLNEGNFYDTIRSSPLVLVLFTSDFCGPCQAMSQTLNKAVGDSPLPIIIGEIKGIDHPEWMEAFAIQSTPTLLLFNEGRYASRITGVHSRTGINKWIKEVVA